MKKFASESLETLYVHSGKASAYPESIPTVPPLYLSNSFRSPSAEIMDKVFSGEESGYTYTRHGNPTVEALAQAIGELEQADVAFTTASGMAAIDVAFYAVGLAPGDTIVLGQDLYGASLNLASQIWAESGVSVHTVDVTNLEELEDVLGRVRPRALLFETLSNPLLKVAPIASIVELAHRFGTRVIVDSTFTTPALVQPLRHGADIVVHSATKYLGGHGDAMGGAICARQPYESRIRQYLKLRGAVLGPFDAWLIHRGMKTLGLRMERQCDNALILARKLEASGAFLKVYHPLLESHPSYQTALEVFGPKRAAAVVTLEIPGGQAGVYRFLNQLRMIGSATTIGDVYTLALYPRMASHRNLSEEELKAMGITDGILRIAVGIENVDDLYQEIMDAVQS